MAEETKSSEGESEAPKHTFKATLVNGEVYYLGNRRFDKGKAGLITDEEKTYLEEATYSETILGPNEEVSSRPVQQFEFKEIKGGEEEDDEESEEEEAEEEATPTRTRTRSRAKAKAT